MTINGQDELWADTIVGVYLGGRYYVTIRISDDILSGKVEEVMASGRSFEDAVSEALGIAIVRLSKSPVVYLVNAHEFNKAIEVAKKNLGQVVWVQKRT